MALKILVPTDLTDVSLNAFRTAVRLYGDLDVEYHLLHVVPKTMSSWGYIDLASGDVWNEKVERQLEKVVKQVQAEAGGKLLKVVTAAKQGVPSDEVDKYQREKKADYIVMGSMGDESEHSEDFGSITAGVIRKSLAPVLAVPNDSHLSRPKKIVFAADLRHISDDKVLSPMLMLADSFGAEICVLNVLGEGEISGEEKKDEIRHLDEIMKDCSHKFEFIEDEDPAHGILQYLDDHHPDMLTMVARRDNFFDPIFHKSVTQKLVKRNDVPLLALHDIKA